MGFTNPNKIFIRPLHLQEIIDAYPVGSTEATTAASIKADLEALINSGVNDVTDPDNPIIFDARTIVDAKCGGNGYYSKQEDTQNEADADVKRLCNSCGAWGKVSVSNTPIKTWTVSEEPKTEV
ncbi:hypothetical protein JST56_07195 [Candidatus Dependentiae bacterium]|nr:hypothetical protein [Candidatus Dependentiae bacterium]